MKIKPIHIAAAVGALFLLKKGKKPGAQPAQKLSFPNEAFDPEQDQDPSAVLARKQQAKRDALAAKRKQQAESDLGKEIEADELELTADTETTALDVAISNYVYALGITPNSQSEGKLSRDEARADAFAVFKQMGGRDAGALQDLLNRADIEMLEDAQAKRETNEPR